MFAVDTFIDTVQGAKKQFVSTFVTDKEIQKPLFAFVDTPHILQKDIPLLLNEMLPVGAVFCVST